MNLSLKNRISNYIERCYPLKVPGGVIEQGAIKFGYMGSNALRRCRELENEGIIDAVYDAKGWVNYKWIPKERISDQQIANLIGGRITNELITL